jgi:hypothetical protein
MGPPKFAWLALSCNPPNLSLLSSWDYRREPYHFNLYFCNNDFQDFFWSFLAIYIYGYNEKWLLSSFAHFKNLVGCFYVGWKLNPYQTCDRQIFSSIPWLVFSACMMVSFVTTNFQFSILSFEHLV